MSGHNKVRFHLPSRSLTNFRSHRGHHRRGAAIVGVLACLLIGTVLIGLTVQSALRGRREAKLERQLTQTEWLCEGGVVRAVSALRKSSDYTGETWQPKLDLEPFRDPVVDIKIDRTASDDWTIQVVAHLDSTNDFDGPMQRSLTLTVKQSSQANINSEKSE